jgi:hypothetical protein
MMRMMRKSLMAGALVSLATVAVSGSANAVVCGDAGATNLALVEALGSCTVEDKTFGFNAQSFSQTNIDAITAANVQVLALPSPGTPNTNPGIRFTGAFLNTSANMPADFTINFTVTAGAGFSITDASLSVMGVTPGTTFSDVETLTPGGVITATNLNPTPAPINFAAVSTLSETENFAITSFAGTGASIIDKRFSETGAVTTPEPASLAILGISLLGMGAATYRRRRK